MKRILVTGGDGFIGSRLLPALNAAGFHAEGARGLELLDSSSIATALSGGPWDVIVHLAGLSHVPSCEKDPARTYQVNLAGTAALIDALVERQPQARLCFASTAQVYAKPEGAEISEGVLFDEDRRIAPQNAYARSKWACELLIQDAVRLRGLRATVLRLFNHTHKSQSPDFFLPHLYSVMSKARPGESLPVPVGNLDVRRDLGAVSDLVRAFEALLRRTGDRGAGGCEVFNVCSGTGKHLGKLAEALAARQGVQARFETDPARMRPGEPLSVVGSHRKLTGATGWKPTCPDEEALISAFLAD